LKSLFENNLTKEKKKEVEGESDGEENES